MLLQWLYFISCKAVVICSLLSKDLLELLLLTPLQVLFCLFTHEALPICAELVLKKLTQKHVIANTLRRIARVLKPFLREPNL
uniref:Secreted protein n=1 Tax=Ascaris lumbricoides TaxID=6252 RepID=A0A0M3IGV5_ASCLU